jgi:hypothetical protein
MPMSKERLVELIRKATESTWTRESLADYLLANGVIVPPCKVGDKVFVICNNEVQETSVFSMSADISDVVSVYFILAYSVDGTRKDKDGYYTSCLNSFRFGLNAFSSREDAEAKLKEGAE